MLQPLPEFPLLRARLQAQIQLKPLRHGQSCLERCNPESTAVGAHALQRPVIKGLVRCSAVVWQAILVDVEAFEVTKGLHRCRPALGEEGQVLPGRCKPECAPDLQHEVAGQILPEIAVLIRRVIGGIERCLVGGTQIVRGRSLHLAVGFHPSPALGEVPADRPLVGILRRNGSGEAAQHGLVQLRPELNQRQRPVKPHIKTFVPGVVEALQNAEASDGIASSGGRP